MPRAASKNPKGRTVPVKRALSALATLIQYGRQSYKKDYHPSLGESLGMALSKCEISPNQSLLLASTLLEDQNAHRMSSIMDKLLAGDFVMDEDKKTVTIRLDY